MEEEFKPGDVVMLKSGSPEFTVAKEKDDNGSIVVAYFDAITNTIIKDRVPAAVFEKVED